MFHFCHSITSIVPTSTVNLPLPFRRHKSIRAAIERGVYQSQRQREPRIAYRSRISKTTQDYSPSRSSQATSAPTRRQSTTDTPSRVLLARRIVPEVLPYTTAASEFLYGYSVVLAALKANRRKLYNLYIHTRGWNNEGRGAILARAKAVNVNVREVGDDYVRLLDRASSGRPHNGFILEASPLPCPPITELGLSSIKNGHFHVKVDKQSKEDVSVNGEQEEYIYKSGGWRNPMMLYVDGVLDEGNLGAIARSAYFLGVDAIATPTRQSAPWSHVALKASAGAAEAIPIFTVKQPGEFLMQSARAGWRIYASDAIPAEELPLSTTSPPKKVTDKPSKIVFTYARSTRRLPLPHCPVGNHPTILMMGAEGTGLRTSLLNQAHFKVGIPAGRDAEQAGVDSLNVSAAASLLCYEFLQKPTPTRKPGDLLF